MGKKLELKKVMKQQRSKSETEKAGKIEITKQEEIILLYNYTLKYINLSLKRIIMLG